MPVNGKVWALSGALLLPLTGCNKQAGGGGGPASGAGEIVVGEYASLTGTKAEHLARWAQARGQANERFDYSGHGASGGAFEVEAKRSGITVTVDEGESIASALEKAGVRISVSCEEGVCGTCLCDVLEGTPDHRDHFLTDEEKAAGDQILICCSRAKTPRLVLDL